MIKIIDNNLVDKYCQFSGDYNNCHLKQLKNSEKKRIIHGGLICDYSINKNIYLKKKEIKRLKITFNNLLNIPAYLKTTIIKNKEMEYKFTVTNQGEEIINYETYFNSQKYPYKFDTNDFVSIDESKITSVWKSNFKKNKTYRLNNYELKGNFFDDAIVNSIYSSSLGLLSKIVGMYIPGKLSTSIIYDIFYNNRQDQYLYLKVINYIPSLSLVRIIVQTPDFKAIINAKNKSPN